MSDLRRAEFEALRATIRERGTLRLCAVLVTFVAWGALTLTLAAFRVEHTAALTPLIVLAAGFEINFFVHTGVERVGRYLQIFYEEPSGSPGWETTAMTFGARFPGEGLDPLFSWLFAASALIDVAASWPANGNAAMALLSLAAHALFGYRIVRARGRSSSQRARDLDHFRAIASK